MTIDHSWKNIIELAKAIILLQKSYCEASSANSAANNIQNVWIEGYHDWKTNVEVVERDEISKNGALDEESIINKEKSFWFSLDFLMLL